MIDPSEFCAHHGDAYAFEHGDEYRCAACLVERVAELERILQRKPAKGEAAGYRDMWEKAVSRIEELEADLARLRSLIPPTFDEKCDALRNAVAGKE